MLLPLLRAGAKTSGRERREKVNERRAAFGKEKKKEKKRKKKSERARNAGVSVINNRARGAGSRASWAKSSRELISKIRYRYLVVKFDDRRRCRRRRR